jgi:hypothetical protein
MNKVQGDCIETHDNFRENFTSDSHSQPITQIYNRNYKE